MLISSSLKHSIACVVSCVVVGAVSPEGPVNPGVRRTPRNTGATPSGASTELKDCVVELTRLNRRQLKLVRKGKKWSKVLSASSANSEKKRKKKKREKKSNAVGEKANASGEVGGGGGGGGGERDKRPALSSGEDTDEYDEPDSFGLTDKNDNLDDEDDNSEENHLQRSVKKLKNKRKKSYYELLRAQFTADGIDPDSSSSSLLPSAVVEAVPVESTCNKDTKDISSHSETSTHCASNLDAPVSAPTPPSALKPKPGPFSSKSVPHLSTSAADTPPLPPPPPPPCSESLSKPRPYPEPEELESDNDDTEDELIIDEDSSSCEILEEDFIHFLPPPDSRLPPPSRVSGRFRKLPQKLQNSPLAAVGLKPRFPASAATAINDRNEHNNDDLTITGIKTSKLSKSVHLIGESRDDSYEKSSAGLVNKMASRDEGEWMVYFYS